MRDKPVTGARHTVDTHTNFSDCTASRLLIIMFATARQRKLCFAIKA